ncbi:MAG: peptide deformylase [Bacilli bacterium]|nr:peptide deformylase [Bacilli bacterium]
MLKIVKDSNPRLREKSKEVPLPLSKEDKALIDEMMEYLKLSQDEEFRAKHPNVREGVGLAAPQVGHNVRMLVVYYPTPTEEEPEKVVSHKLVNPQIVVNSIRKTYLEAGEGCLSVDGEHKGYVYRDFKIVVEAFEADEGEKVRITARGFDAIVLQHEIDHLNGVLFYDHIDPKDPFKKIPGAYSC